MQCGSGERSDEAAGTWQGRQERAEVASQKEANWEPGAPDSSAIGTSLQQRDRVVLRWAAKRLVGRQRRHGNGACQHSCATRRK